MKLRRPLSKRTRFEVFKRDGFKCLYCGVTPVQAVLRVDHVRPVVDGGTDDPVNLVTSCFDCNAGKGPVPLDQRKHATGVATEADKEHAEQILEWLKLQRGIRQAKDAVIEELVSFWEDRVGYVPVELRSRLRVALEKEGHDAVMLAIERVGQKRLPSVATQFQYFYGVLRRVREERG